MTDAYKLNETLARWQHGAFAVALVGFALCGLAALFNVEQFLRSYLLGFLFWWAVTLGCLGTLMLYYLTGGRWGAAVKPLLQCGSWITPLSIALFLPVALGVWRLYPWADGGLSGTKGVYLSPLFFYGRAVVYFAATSWLAWLICRGNPDSQADRPEPLRLRSAGGLVLLFLVVTFASIDWAMSLDPAWYSSIYGALVAMGGALAALALVTLMLAVLQWRQQSASGVVLSQTLADLGTLILAFLMLWAYFAFSQFLIIWSGNLPEESEWYVNRLRGGWQWLGLTIVILQFALPFLALLSRDLKRDPRTLALIAALIFVMQFFYFLWTLSPSFHPGQFYIHWADFVAPIAIGGLWGGVFLWWLRKDVPRILLIINQP